MPALLLSLLPLLGQYAPDLIGLAMGGHAGDVAKRVEATVTRIFGTTEPAAVQAAVQADPSKAATLQAQLAADAAALQAQLADVANARDMEVRIAGMDGLTARILAFAPLALGVFNLGMFAWVVWFFFTGHNVDSPNGNLIVGAIIGAYASTQAFYTGASAIGKHRTDQALDAAYQAAPASRRAR